MYICIYIHVCRMRYRYLYIHTCVPNVCCVCVCVRVYRGPVQPPSCQYIVAVCSIILLGH
jgi:hypothetical protein